MNIQEFGQTIKKQHPEYNDIPDAELGQKILDKYPQYQDMVSTTIESPAKKGLVSDVKGAFGSAVSKAKESNTMRREGKQGLASNLLQNAGTIAHLGTDVAFDVAKAGAKTLVNAIPDNSGFKKQVASGAKFVGENILQTPAGQKGLELAGKGIEQYNTWKAANPIHARNLEAAVDIASILPPVKAVEAGLPIAEGFAKTLTGEAKTFVEKAATATSKEVQKKVSSSLENQINSLESKYNELFQSKKVTHLALFSKLRTFAEPLTN